MLHTWTKRILGVYIPVYTPVAGDSRLVTLDEILLQKVVSTDVTPSATKQQMTLLYLSASLYNVVPRPVGTRD